MGPFITKIIVVDEGFLQDLGEQSRTDLNEFSKTGMDTKVLSLPIHDEKEIDALSRVMDIAAIRPGSVLVKGGYTDQFVPVETFSEELIFRKYGLFVQLCIALGARTVAISNIENVALESNASESLSLGASAGSLMAGGEAKFKHSNSALIDQLQKCNTNFRTKAEGGKPDFAAATDLIERYGLHKDSLFMDMMGICSNANNRVTLYEVSLDFSKDVKKILDSSMQAKIKVMAKLYKGSADFEAARHCVEQNRTATKLTVVVEF